MNRFFKLKMKMNKFYKIMIQNKKYYKINNFKLIIIYYSLMINFQNQKLIIKKLFLIKIIVI